MPDNRIEPLHAGSRSLLFTVRLWFEDLGQGQGEWRGKAEHVASKEACYFRDWSRLIVFFQEGLAQEHPLAHRESPKHEC